MVNWKRPENVPFPSVWHTFQAKDSDSDEIVNYRVEDLPEDRFADAVDLMMDYFLKEEVMGAMKGLSDCPESSAEIRELWERYVTQKMSLACFKEGSTELIGINILIVEQKNVKEEPPKSKLWAEIFAAMEYVKKSVNIFQKYNTDVYMSSSGLWVSSKYRGNGIGHHLLVTRIPLGKAVGLTCTSTLFTSIESQKSAARAGFEEMYSCSSAEYKSNGIDYPDIVPFKIMAMKLS